MDSYIITLTLLGRDTFSVIVLFGVSGFEGTDLRGAAWTLGRGGLDAPSLSMVDFGRSPLIPEMDKIIIYITQEY